MRTAVLVAVALVAIGGGWASALGWPYGAAVMLLGIVVLFVLGVLPDRSRVSGE
jgi:hypothetical protein